MTNCAQIDRLTAFLLNLECLDAAGQKEAFECEALETGGSFAKIDHIAFDGSTFVVSLHGLTIAGQDEDHAIRTWKTAAYARTPMVEADGFITVHPPFPDPQNHAEEIANALAADGRGID